MRVRLLISLLLMVIGIYLFNERMFSKEPSTEVPTSRQTSSIIHLSERFIQKRVSRAKPGLNVTVFVTTSTTLKLIPTTTLSITTTSLAPTTTVPSTVVSTSSEWSSAEASWYGPGFYGNGTACGQRYDDQILGVAHKTLPCGTIVTFRHNGVELSVPVIDRGPFTRGRMWDLSAGACRALNHCFTDQIDWKL